jgi:hypothetical protein
VVNVINVVNGINAFKKRGKGAEKEGKRGHPVGE